MLWERAPNSTKSAETGTSAEGLSKELLRRVCEPFFEQMLTTLLGVLQGQNPYGSPISEKEAFEACFQPPHSSQVERLSEEGSNPDDLGAFSSVLVDSNFGQATAHVAAPPTEQASDAAKVSPGAKPKDQDKSATVIVCRHWKSKGWCRMAENCKFAHPDHKCGVGAPNGAKGPEVQRPSDTGEHARAEGAGGKHASSSSDDETGANGAGQKKTARKRRSKAKGNKAPSPAAAQPTMVPPGILHAVNES